MHVYFGEKKYFAIYLAHFVCDLNSLSYKFEKIKNKIERKHSDRIWLD